MSATSDTPAGLLAALAASDPTRPRLTWYDDTPGPTQGERIELSGRVLATWSAKAAGLLQEEFDAGPGTVVAIDLPVHWRAAYWLFAIWSVGAHAVLAVDGDGSPADVVVTDRPVEARAAGADAAVAVSLPALARRWAGDALDSSTIDEAGELHSYSDVFAPVTVAAATSSALTTPSGQWSYAELVPAARVGAAACAWGERPRILTTRGPADAVPAWLAPWSADGSLVLVRPGGEADPVAWTKRRADERVSAEFA